MSSNPDVPPFVGYVETTVNALRLIHAARQGVIPRITRRLNDSERRTMIKSGAVFVFSVEESGIKRWTDGLLWSPSRIVGNFLVYREINERSSTRGGQKKPYPADASGSPTRTMIRRNSPDQTIGGYRSHTSNTSEQGTFKPNGLIKKTITVTVEGSDLHLISYYTSEDIRSGRLQRPSARLDIMSLHMPPHIFRLTNFRVPPKVEIGPDGKPRLACEVEETEPSSECKIEDQSHQIPASPPWSSSSGQVSPVDSPFPGSALYSVGSSDMYGRGSHSLVMQPSRVDPWSQSSTAPYNDIQQRRDTGMLSDAISWSHMHGSSGRWHGSSQEPLQQYPDRSRIRPGALYGEIVANQRRDKPEGHSPTSSHRYPAQIPGRRDSHSQRMQWHPRQASENARDRRSSPHTGTSFTPSPTIPFPQQFQTTNQSYGAPWSNDDGSLIPMNSNLSSYTYSPASRQISTGPGFTDAEDFGEPCQ